MWTSFIESMTVAVLILYIPGIALLHTGGIKNTYGVLLAPLASIFMLGFIGEVFAYTNTVITPAGLWLMATLAGLVIGAIFNSAFKIDIDFPEIPKLASILYVLAGVVGLIVVYTSAVSSPEEFCQSVDMAHHINTVQSFLDASTFSSMKQSMYMGPLDVSINPWHGGGFYPSAYHICCALVASMAGVSNALAINAFNALLCSVAFPLTMLGFNGYVFEGKKFQICAGALFVVAIPAFPWDYLVYGPLYPNLMGFSIMMLEAVVFMKLCEVDLPTKERWYIFGLFILGGIALSLTHPSTIFFLAIFLMPFCVDRIVRYAFNKEKKSKRIILKAIAVGSLLIVWALFFIGLYHTGMVQKMASFDWGVILNHKNAFYSILTSSYMGIFYCAPSAFVFAAFVLVGFIYSFVDRRYLWIAVAYLMFCFAIYVNSTSDGAFKHFIGSFWYTDPLRFASMAAIVGVILATLGFGCVTSWIFRSVKSTTAANWIVGILVGAVGCFSFLPLNVPGWYGSLFPLGSAHENIERSMKQSLYTPEKKEFIAHIKSIVEKDALIINVPGDGSKFIYGADGMRMLYRSHGGYDSISNEKRDSRLIRQGLDEYTTDKDVAHALEAMNAQYVVLLNPDEQYGNLEDENVLLQRNKFRGILDIDESTPGFELIYSQGKYKLYKITGIGA